MSESLRDVLEDVPDLFGPMRTLRTELETAEVQENLHDARLLLADAEKTAERLLKKVQELRQRAELAT